MASGLSLHFVKYRADTGTINGLQRHFEREPGGRHSNKNIDDARTNDNVILYHSDDKLNIRVDNRIKSGRTNSKKAVRRDATRMVSVSVQISGDIANMPRENQVKFMKDSYGWLCDRYGKDNVVSAAIHLDETSTHLHFAFVPITEEGGLSARKMLGNQNNLRHCQKEFLEWAQADMPSANFKRKEHNEFNGLPQDQFEHLQDGIKAANKQIDQMAYDKMNSAQKASDEYLDKRLDEMMQGFDKKVDDAVKDKTKFVRTGYQMSLAQVKKESESLSNQRKELNDDREQYNKDKAKFDKDKAKFDKEKDDFDESYEKMNRLTTFMSSLIDKFNTLKEATVEKVSKVLKEPEFNPLTRDSVDDAIAKTKLELDDDDEVDTSGLDLTHGTQVLSEEHEHKGLGL